MAQDELSLKEYMERRDRRRRELAHPEFILYCDLKVLEAIGKDLPAEWTSLEKSRMTNQLREQYLATFPDCCSCGRGDQALTAVLGLKYCLECFRTEKARQEGRYSPLYNNLTHLPSRSAGADIRYHGDGKTELLGRQRKNEKKSRED